MKRFLLTFSIVVIIAIVTSGCSSKPMSTAMQTEAIKLCKDEGLMWYPRRSLWDDDLIGIKCVEPDLRPALPPSVLKCLTDGSDAVYTDMDAELLERKCFAFDR